MLAVIAVILSLSLIAPALPPQELPEEFRACAEAVAPDAGQLAWEQVSWRASFAAGVLEADSSDKPVLLWAMNGHPLGCT